MEARSYREGKEALRRCVGVQQGAAHPSRARQGTQSQRIREMATHIGDGSKSCGPRDLVAQPTTACIIGASLESSRPAADRTFDERGIRGWNVVDRRAVKGP
jgi:hypothetical protein